MPWASPGHLDPFATHLRRYPKLGVVLDHCMKPQIRGHSPASFQHWADGISRLADTGAFCKFSALITGADADWTVSDLKPDVGHIFTAFGPDRVMWGSDWPVCRQRDVYDYWHNAAQRMTEHLPDQALAQIFGGTATRFFRL